MFYADLSPAYCKVLLHYVVPATDLPMFPA